MSMQYGSKSKSNWKITTIAIGFVRGSCSQILPILATEYKYSGKDVTLEGKYWQFSGWVHTMFKMDDRVQAVFFLQHVQSENIHKN